MEISASSPAGRGPDVAAMRRAAVAFEGQALGALLQPMFEGLAVKGPFGGGAGEAQWQPMMVAELGRAIAGSGGLGLADSVLRQMLANQEARG